MCGIETCSRANERWKQSRRYATALLGRGWAPVTLSVLAALVVLGGGCDTPYTRRLRWLDETYQRGDLSRDDYMRFVHEAEPWETR